MRLVELASGTWSETLRELSRDCTGGAAAVRSSGAGRSSPRPASPLYWPLQVLRYDEERRELEVSVGLTRGARPSLRCFVSEPRRIFLARRRGRRALLVFDASGASTWIELAATADDSAAEAHRGRAGDTVPGTDERDAGPPAIASAGG